LPLSSRPRSSGPYRSATRAGSAPAHLLENAAEESRAPLKPQLEDVLGRIRYGDDPQVVLRSLMKRVPLETFRLFASALSVHWEVGGSLAPTLAIVDAGPLLAELNVLTRCDCTTRNERRAALLARRMDELEARIGELAAEEELKSIRPELDGNQVMERLGLRPGPVVGQAMTFLLELRLDEGPLGEDEVGRRLDAWWAEQQRAGPPA
jgi:hypothetical protein